MEDPKAVIMAELKTAMKNKDSDRRNVLRLLQSAIKQIEVDSRKELDSAGVIDVLQKEGKKRREAIADMKKAGRDEQAAQEAYELGVIEEFLPEQLSEQEIATIVDEVIADVGASSPKDMGQVMGPVMARVKGKADGKVVSKIVKQQLSS